MKLKLINGENKAILAKIRSLDKSKDWLITIDPIRTDAQKKRYFKFLDAYSKHSGIHVLDLHDNLKEKFLPNYVDLKLIIEPGSITTESVRSFAEFMEKCEIFALEEGFEWN